MRNKNFHILRLITLVMLMGFMGVTSFSQSKTDKLKAKEKQLNKQLEQTQELLSATQKSQNSTLSELRIINKQIAFKEELLINMGNQIKETTYQIKSNKKEVESLNQSILRLKKEFREMVRFAYKNRKREYSVIYLFSSEDYNQAYRRLKYIEQYSENRKLKAVEVKNMQVKLRKENEILLANIESKKEMIASYDEEKKKFQEVKDKQQIVLNKILSNKEVLQAKLKKQEAEQERIAQAIRAEIEKQMAKSRKNNSFALSPEAKLASNSFEKNRGKLPWPVSRGTITKRYGKQRHSEISTAYVQNNGIDISTLKGSNVRAVFEGKVTSVFTIPGSGQTVIISHGAYRTVYSNLKSVKVEVGQSVKTKQEIGVLLPDPSGTISESHFEIWKISGSDMSTQNPAIWLYKS
ncbi:peptidoglycan DD-metalloendopeptidase family protein, partial [bacterium]|nr:peptidoglycan DD-metalloendopeptidase family protein [bacterium]MDB9931639.1 peptidoglycan DD-metalloendopeptidase family protein [Flavobacteriales bacterium]